MNEQNYEQEFATEEEAERAFRKLLDSVIKNDTENEPTLSIINHDMVFRLFYAYNLLKYLTKDSSAVVTYTLLDSGENIGTISIKGTNIKFDKPEWFAQIARIASGFDVYPKTDGTIQMDLIFYNIIIPSV